ncbi:putative protease with the C-terminal PDZ domain [Burkholderiales bacterium JOSHI_001]|nr:putative protease with the C-terminal PDZ domain [Burkholderiales bacterium JOSHI_001]
MLRYRVDVGDLHAHQFEVSLTLPAPAACQRVSLPVWIPGSYMVREFGRHLHGLQARQGTRECAITQVDKTTWDVACGGRGALTLRWRVYAFDTSVRAAFLDARRGFFNGTGLLLRAHGREAGPHELRIGRLPRGWFVATGMTAHKVDARGVGSYQAADYDELVDHPVEMGAFWRGRFTVRGAVHELVVAGALPSFDAQRLLADTRRICETQINFWHGPNGKPPFARYVFMLNAVEDGYGGLEHRASTALIAARRDLPRLGMTSVPDGYVTLLGLISHEYFHTWNVKRLKPAEFARFDYTQENYTRLLWFFEGFTSYYDDQMLLRAGLIDAPRYLKLLAKGAAAVQSTPGRQVQSVAESSFDAWVKYYRSDENTPNATVSYYAKGSLVALALDLTLRTGRSAATLDELMRWLWQHSAGGPIDHDLIAQGLRELGKRSFGNELAAWVDGRSELPLAELLRDHGVTLTRDKPGFTAALGLRLSEGAVSGVQVKQVLAGSAAMAAGLSAGDELLAVDGWRIRRLDDAANWVASGQPFDLLLVRDQRVLTLRVDPRAGSTALETLTLALAERPTAAVAQRRRAWLGA